MLGPQRMQLDLSLFLFVTFGTLIVGRLMTLAVPLDYYFTFQSLFSDRPGRNLVVSALVRMAGPLIFGAIVGHVVFRRSVAAPPRRRGLARFRRRLRISWSPTVFLGGFAAAFLAAWPNIIYWDLLSNPALSDLKAVFFGLYLVYMLAFGFVGLFGFLGAILANEHLASGREGANLVSLGELSRVGFLWIANSGLASGALAWLTK